MKLGLLALPLAYLLVAISVGCSDSSVTQNLDEYFAEFEAIDTDLDEQIGALYVDFPEDGDFITNAANLTFFKDLVAGFAVAIGNSVERLKALNPPSEVETEHNVLVDAGEELTIALEEGSDVLQEAETMADFATLNQEVDPDIAVATTRFVDACLDVVAFGEANGITFIVTCSDE